MSSLLRKEQYIDRLPDHLGKNKSVVLVGPSKYLEKEKKGSTIDRFDTVARIKGGFHMTTNASAFGTQTDVIFQDCLDKWYDMSKVQKQYKFNNIIYVYPPFEKHGDTLIRSHAITNYFRNKDPDYIRSSSIYCVDEDYYRVMENRNETIPNTGVVGLDIILNTPEIKFCYITGMTYYIEGYNVLYEKAPFKKLMEKKNLHFNKRKQKKKTNDGKSTRKDDPTLEITDPNFMTERNRNRHHDYDKMRLNFVKKYLCHPKLYVDQYLLDMLLKRDELKNLIDVSKIKIFDPKMLL